MKVWLVKNVSCDFDQRLPVVKKWRQSLSWRQEMFAIITLPTNHRQSGERLHPFSNFLHRNGQEWPVKNSSIDKTEITALFEREIQEEGTFWRDGNYMLTEGEWEWKKNPWWWSVGRAIGWEECCYLKGPSEPSNLVKKGYDKETIRFFR